MSHLTPILLMLLCRSDILTHLLLPHLQCAGNRVRKSRHLKLATALRHQFDNLGEAFYPRRYHTLLLINNCVSISSGMVAMMIVIQRMSCVTIVKVKR